MTAPSAKVVIPVAVVVAALMFAGVVGWRRMAPGGGTPSAMMMSVPGARDLPAPASSGASGQDRSGQASNRPGGIVADKAEPKTIAAAGPAATPSFDIVRVEPTGDALVAGRGKPNETVALVSGGRVVTQGKADAGGNFVLMPPTLKPGDYSLSLRAGQGPAATDSTQSVVVSVPRSKTQPVVVAMAEPGKPTTLLSMPPQTDRTSSPSGAAPGSIGAKAQTTPAAPLAIGTVELENGSGLLASGTAPPGASVRFYLNGSHVTDAVASAAGQWTVTVRKGLAAGRYIVRADSVKGDKSVIARVEVPFEVPAPMAVAEAAVPPDPMSASPATPQGDVSRESAGDVVVETLQTDRVAKGDSLWRISRKRLGHGVRYTEIYAANSGQIRDPELVYPGQVFVMPHE